MRPVGAAKEFWAHVDRLADEPWDRAIGIDEHYGHTAPRQESSHGARKSDELFETAAIDKERVRQRADFQTMTAAHKDKRRSSVLCAACHAYATIARMTQEQRGLR